MNRANGPDGGIQYNPSVRRLEQLAEDAASFDAYWQEITRVPSLSVDEEQRLATRVEQQDDEAVAELARSQLPLVVRYARPYARLGVSLLELVHDGNLALLEAARRFRPGSPRRFASEARWWVRQGVLHRVSLAGGMLGPNQDARTGQLVAALGTAVEQACADGIDATDRPLSAPEVRALDHQWRRSPPVAPAGWTDEDPDLDDLAPLLVDADDDSLRQALVSEIESSLLDLEPNERRALELRLGLLDGEPRSLDQVGDRLRMSPARAERLSRRAVDKLRRQRAWRSPLN